MPLMQAKLYRALIEAKVPELDAIAAAEEAAGDLTELKSDVKLLKWMVGAIFATRHRIVQTPTNMTRESDRESAQPLRKSLRLTGYVATVRSSRGANAARS